MAHRTRASNDVLVQYRQRQSAERSPATCRADTARTGEQRARRRTRCLLVGAWRSIGRDRARVQVSRTAPPPHRSRWLKPGPAAGRWLPVPKRAVTRARGLLSLLCAAAALHVSLPLTSACASDSANGTENRACAGAGGGGGGRIGYNTEQIQSSTTRVVLLSDPVPVRGMKQVFLSFFFRAKSRLLSFNSHSPKADMMAAVAVRFSDRSCCPYSAEDDSALHPPSRHLA